MDKSNTRSYELVWLDRSEAVYRTPSKATDYTGSHYKMSLAEYDVLGRPNTVQITVTATPAP